MTATHEDLRTYSRKTCCGSYTMLCLDLGGPEPTLELQMLWADSVFYGMTILYDPLE